MEPGLKSTLNELTVNEFNAYFALAMIASTCLDFGFLYVLKQHTKTRFSIRNRSAGGKSNNPRVNGQSLLLNGIQNEKKY